MRFLLTTPAFIGEGHRAEYIPARPDNPVVKELPDDQGDAILKHVSRAWTPLDAAARKALQRLGVTKPIGVPPEPPVPPAATPSLAELQRQPVPPAPRG